MKILSIDGGGIKGLYSAAFIAGLEDRFQKRIIECFDLVAGTSTGGILALGLAAGIPAKRIVEFYEKWGTEIFHKKSEFLSLLLSFFTSKYDNKKLKKALLEVFGNLRINDINQSKPSIALCIPSINAITGEPIVFKTQHNPKLIRDNECFLWQIALATSAAPTFFPLVKLKNPFSNSYNVYVDGGLWANNPSQVALVEALTYHESKLQDIYLLSIGNIKSRTCFKSNTFLKKGVLSWRNKVISMTLDTQSYSIHNQLKLLFSSQGLSDHYHRIEEDVSYTHNYLQSLDSAEQVNLNDLKTHGFNRSNNEGVKEYLTNLFE